MKVLIFRRCEFVLTSEPSRRGKYTFYFSNFVLCHMRVFILRKYDLNSISAGALCLILILKLRCNNDAREFCVNNSMLVNSRNAFPLCSFLTIPSQDVKKPS